MRTLLFVALIGLASVGARPVHAQFFYPYQSRASTVGESYARGVSDMVVAAGQANLLNSEAAINVETARSAYLDNRLKATDTYFEMRRRNREYREAERGPRPTSEQLFRLANERVPTKLSVSELDPLTGAVAWPLLLQRPEFDAHRATLEKAFGEWAAADGNLSGENYLKIQQAGREMLNLLRANVRQYTDDLGVTTATITAARSFLQSLLHQSSQGA